jgi:D-inositol-3-phosphate glycosyltransferase
MLAPAISGARVVRNGVDLQTFRPAGRAHPPPAGGIPRLVFSANGGAANPHKDFATLRSAVRGLEGPLEIVAVGGDRGEEELGDGIRLRHEPRMSTERLAALHRSAVAGIHASAEESFGLAAAESLACGTPVVAASSGGISEVVDDGVTGFVHTPGDARGVAASLRSLLAQPGLRERMSAAAVAGRERFDRDRMVREMHDLCVEAVNEWPR